MTNPAKSPVPIEVSVVMPVVERHGDLTQLFEEYSAQLERTGKTWEMIFVVDQRLSETIPTLEQLARLHPARVSVVVLGGTFGESTALTVGFQHCAGTTILTLASYFQVDPEGVDEALERVENGADMVVGCRYPRRGSWFNRLQARAFHWLVAKMTSTDFNDISCGFRVLKRLVATELNVYGGLHRFLPIIAARSGFQVEELKLAQREEDRPTRYYGVSVYLKRVLDVVTVFFLLKFTRRPLRFFGLVGLALGSIGVAVTGYLGIYRLLHLGPIAGRPLLLLGVLLMVLGVQSLSIGLIGEIIIFTHARKIRDYRVAEIIGASGDRDDRGVSWKTPPESSSTNADESDLELPKSDATADSGSRA